MFESLYLRQDDNITKYMFKKKLKMAGKVVRNKAKVVSKCYS